MILCSHVHNIQIYRYICSNIHNIHLKVLHKHSITAICQAGLQSTVEEHRKAFLRKKNQNQLYFFFFFLTVPRPLLSAWSYSCSVLICLLFVDPLHCLSDTLWEWVVVIILWDSAELLLTGYRDRWAEGWRVGRRSSRRNGKGCRVLVKSSHWIDPILSVRDIIQWQSTVC